MTATSIYKMLQLQADIQPEAEAILAPGQKGLTYRELCAFVSLTSARINDLGIGRNDPVAIVLPNGPVMATAFLSVASCATSAPLNPAYKESEFDFYLGDLNPRAVMLLAGTDSPVRNAAAARAIPVIELASDPAGAAGRFTLSGAPQPSQCTAGFSEPDDIALVLHTSGTTSRPKMVPLTQRNLCVSARNVCGSLALTPSDRCLNVMPLFHIHGLVAAVMASLSEGAGVVCTPGFYAPQFFQWMDETRPTWYTAVPAMHQSILSRAAENREAIARTNLRFIRSCSASLPPQVMQELEQVFSAPVIEAYGMTEAAHQMACNPLPPRSRKPGSVGVAAGPEVAVMAEDSSALLPPGQKGEIVIRGPNVMPGYVNNPEANSRAFTDGWFRTGDQGYVDEDGYFFVTSRLKEIINRGGEKISPREIDEALLEHPAVAQALAFAWPDKSLGEDVAAAVVLRQKEVTAKDLRKFAAQRLADFKVPRRIFILDELPKGPTGKPQRIGLAERLGLTEDGAAPDAAKADFVAPRTPTERILAELWCQALQKEEVSVEQKFEDAGGDSMLAAVLLNLVSERFRIEPASVEFFDVPTIAAQAKLVDALLLQEPTP